MEEYKVSCIIPAYNAEATLPALLESLQDMVYDNMEIIVVNDGSTDGTWDVIQEWQKKDPKIVPINKENGGVGSARNAGLDAATGDFVCFFDADDTVYRGAVKRHVRRMSKEGVVMSIGETMSVHMNEEHIMKSTVRLGENTNIRKYTKSLNWSNSVWNKCFRRDLIEKNHLRFNDTTHAEDALFLFQYIHSTDGIIAGIPALVYRYVKRSYRDEESLSKRIDMTAIDGIESNVRQIVALVDKSIAADKADLEESTELTPEEVQKKYENMASYRSNLYRRFVHSAILNEYYRFLWNTGDGVYEKLKDLYEEYMSNISEEDIETIYSQNADLRLEGGMMSPEQLAGIPMITVVVSDNVPSDKASALVSGWYNQNFPAFEILIGEKAAKNVSSDLTGRLNLHVMSGYKDASFKNEALARAKGKYIFFCDEYMIPSTSVVLEMYQLAEEKKLDLVTAILLRFSGKKAVNMKMYNVLSGRTEPDKLSVDDMKLLDSTIWGNKMFRVDALKENRTFQSKAGKPDCLRKLTTELSGVLYSDNAFISRFKEEDLADRLGLFEKMAIKKKLK